MPASKSPDIVISPPLFSIRRSSTLLPPPTPKPRRESSARASRRISSTNQPSSVFFRQLAPTKRVEGDVLSRTQVSDRERGGVCSLSPSRLFRLSIAVGRLNRTTVGSSVFNAGIMATVGLGGMIGWRSEELGTHPT